MYDMDDVVDLEMLLDAMQGDAKGLKYVMSGLGGVVDAEVKISLYDGDTGQPLRTAADVNALLAKGRDPYFGINRFKIICDIFVESDCRIKGWIAKHKKLGPVVHVLKLKEGSRVSDNKLWKHGVLTHPRNEIVSTQYIHYDSSLPVTGFSKYLKHQHIFGDLYYCLTVHDCYSDMDLRLTIGMWNE